MRGPLAAANREQDRTSTPAGPARRVGCSHGVTAGERTRRGRAGGADGPPRASFLYAGSHPGLAPSPRCDRPRSTLMRPPVTGLPPDRRRAVAIIVLLCIAVGSAARLGSGLA